MPKKYKFVKYFKIDGVRYVVRADSEFELIQKYTNKVRDIEEGKVILAGSTTVEDWTKSKRLWFLKLSILMLNVIQIQLYDYDLSRRNIKK